MRDVPGLLVGFFLSDLIMLPILKRETQLRFYFTPLQKYNKTNQPFLSAWIRAGEIELMPRKHHKELSHSLPTPSFHWKIERWFFLLEVSPTNLLHGFSKWHQCDSNLEVLCSWQIFFFPFNHYSQKGGGFGKPKSLQFQDSKPGDELFCACLLLVSRISCFDSFYVNKWV